jgi:hypothetical protein
MYEFLLKQEKQNVRYNEFLKLKKNYNEEYLKQKEFEDDKTKYENVYLKIPYRSINKSLTITQEKTKNNTLSTPKNKNNTLINIARQREKRQTKRYEKVDNKETTLIDEKETKELELENSLKKLIEEKQTEKNKMEETSKELELQQQKLDKKTKF